MDFENIFKDSAYFSRLQLAKEAALKSGEILLGFYEKNVRIERKGRIDLVTEADIASEKAAIDLIRQKMPVDLILSEESNPTLDKIPEAGMWVIDPLDGTTNFAHGFPWFCVSIAYVEHGKPVVGVIYLPIQRELFCVVKGFGAWLNGKKIAVSSASELSNALLATGFPYDIQKQAKKVLSAFGAVITNVQGIRRAGAAAIDLAYVACARLDGFWEVNLKAWDTAAGILLVEEAGGVVSDFKGGAYSIFCPELLASNANLQPKLADLLKPFSVAH